MERGKAIRQVRGLTRSAIAMGLAVLLAGIVTAATTRAKSEHAERVVSHRTIDRAEIENLQRWVAAGHEDWCKDARLVAAAEVKRIAAGFAEDATELMALDETARTVSEGGAKKLMFEWTPIDGSATYQVTVERFEWLLPIAKDAENVVWVPTTTEIQRNSASE